MSESRVFDRAAGFYDETRALPDDAMREVVDRLRAELDGRGHVLEIGVGTGRIALPLHDAGVPMAGVDLSGPMMSVLVDKAGGTPPFPLARADATALPFCDARFGGAVASHVFHLIPTWREAVHELLRVVRRGGVVLSSGRERGRDLEGSVYAAVHRRFRAEAGVERDHIGARHDGTDVADEFARLGARERRLEPVGVRRTVTAGAVIDQLEANRWSWTWSLPEDVVRRAAEATREWVTREMGPLDAPRALESQVVWRAYDLPG